jgi:hypothetical protein
MLQEEKMDQVDGEGDVEDVDDDGDESDMEIDRSVGVELNERLRAAVALHEAGHATTVIDEDWEQWLKENVESGGIPALADYILPASESNNPSNASSTTVPPRPLNAARLGQWHQIPEFLQDMVRQNIDAHSTRSEYTPPTEQISQRRENAIPVSGRTSLRSVSTNAPVNVQQRLASNSSPSMRRLSYHPQAPAGSLRSAPQSWQQRFQQEDNH